MKPIQPAQLLRSQFDAVNFASISNQVPSSTPPLLKPSSAQVIRKYYQQAKQAGLFNLHQRFLNKAEPTIGIEGEFYLAEARSGELAPKFDEVYQLLPEWAQRLVTKETFKFQLEIVTGIHRSVRSAGRELERCLTAITAATDQLGLELLWQAGIKDFEVDFNQLSMTERTRSTLRRQPEKLVLLHHNGMHVHVGVSRDDVIGACDYLASQSHQIIGRSANSQLQHNGLITQQSQRCNAWMNAFPTLPQRYYRNWKGFYAAMREQNRRGIVLEPKDNYAWCRPSTHGTIEVRTADMPKDLSTVLEVAEFIQQEVTRACSSDPQPLPPIDLVRKRCQQAARLGNAYQDRSLLSSNR